MDQNPFGNAFPDKIPKQAVATPALDTDVDPTIKALASTIGELETGPASEHAYTRKGASGEYGRYQFMPDTYKNYARKYLGDMNAAPTMENQNKIVYNFIKEKKSAGYNPAQIMSMWNAGEKRPDAYKQNWKGVNSQGVSFDTPGYVQKGSAIYQQKKLLAAPTMGSAPQVAQSQDNSFGTDVSNTVTDAAKGISSALQRGISREINPFSSGLQAAGALAGGVGGLGMNVLEHLPVVGGVVKGAENLLGKGVEAAAGTQLGQSVVSGAQGFAQAHPELAGDIGAVANIAGVAGGGIGGAALKDVAQQGIKGAVTKGLLRTPFKGAVERRATRTLAASADDLTKGELERAASRVLPDGAILPSKTETRAGQILAGKVSSDEPVKNFSAISSEIQNLGKEAERYLVKNAKTVSNLEDFNAFNALKNSAKKYMTQTESNAYDEQIKVFQNILKGYGKYTTPNYYKALKEFESNVTDNLPKGQMALLVPGGSARIQAAKDVRKVVRDLIAKKHRKFKGRMFDLASLYDVKDTAAGRVAKLAKRGKQPGLVKSTLKNAAKAGIKYGIQGAGFGGAAHLLGD